jgi:hypothetical protein
MSGYWSDRDLLDRQSHVFLVLGQRALGGMMRVTAAAAAVVLAGLWIAKPSPLVAGAGWAQDGAKAAAAIPAAVSGFLGATGRRLHVCHERIARLGDSLLEASRGPEPSDLESAGAASRILAAEAREKSARLAREIAELKLKEYLESTFPQEKAACEGGLAQAQDDLKRAMTKRVTVIERFQRIKELSKGSASDLELEYRFESGLVVAELEQRRAELSIEQAKSKLKVLREFEKDKRTKELQADIKRALSQELAQRADMGFARGKLVRVERENKNLRAGDTKLLQLLDDAISIDGAVRNKIEQLRKTGKTDPELQKEITTSTNQLETVVDRAEAERALARFDALHDAIERARSR